MELGDEGQTGSAAGTGHASPYWDVEQSLSCGGRSDPPQPQVWLWRESPNMSTNPAGSAPLLSKSKFNPHSFNNMGRGGCAAASSSKCPMPNVVSGCSYTRGPLSHSKCSIAESSFLLKPDSCGMPAPAVSPVPLMGQLSDARSKAESPIVACRNDKMLQGQLWNS